jgi:hypothetical protein
VRIAGGQAPAPFDLFGQANVLLRAAREGPDARVAAAAKRLLNGNRLWAAEQQLPDELTRNQFRQLMKGMASVVQSACARGQNFGVTAAKTAIDAFSTAWPTSAPVVPSLHRNDSMFDVYFNEFSDKPAAGFWVVWDLLDRLKPGRHGGGNGGQPAVPLRSASIPVLLYMEQQGTAKVGLLTVEVVPDEQGGFVPDPWGLGLTTVFRNEEGPDGTDLNKPPHKDDFFASMQRAWAASGLSQRNCRARWRIENYDAPLLDGSHHLALPVLKGRSCEAAACCALWAAMGGKPGDTPTLRPLKLDSKMSISATLESADEKGAMHVLGIVGEVYQKLNSSLQRGLVRVLLCRGQPIVWPSQVDEKLRNLPLERTTVAEAFEKLLAFNISIDNYHHQQVNADGGWLREWPVVVGDDGFAELRKADEQPNPAH